MESGPVPPEGATVDLRVDMMSIDGINNYESWGYWYPLSQCISITASWASRIPYLPAICSFNPQAVFVPHPEKAFVCRPAEGVSGRIETSDHTNDPFISVETRLGEIVQTNNETRLELQKRFHLLDPNYNAARKHKQLSVCVLLPKICSSRSSFHCGPQLVICSLPVFKKEAIILISFKSVSNVSRTHTHTLHGCYGAATRWVFQFQPNINWRSVLLMLCDVCH